MPHLSRREALDSIAASLTTTERYLGVHQDLHNAPCDYAAIGRVEDIRPPAELALLGLDRL